MNTPDDLRYAETHEWARKEDDGTIRVGITDFAQDQLGDVVFVELPVVSRKVAKGDTLAVIESVKTASDIYAPVSGEVVVRGWAVDRRARDGTGVRATPGGGAGLAGPRGGFGHRPTHR